MSIGAVETILFIFMALIAVCLVLGAILFCKTFAARSVAIIMAIGIIILFFFLDKSIIKHITNEYDSCKIKASYEVVPSDDLRYFTPPGNSRTTISYFDQNNEVKYVRSDLVRIMYDLADDTNPYVEKIEYERWIFYWDELILHLRK